MACSWWGQGEWKPAPEVQQWGNAVCKPGVWEHQWGGCGWEAGGRAWNDGTGWGERRDWHTGSAAGTYAWEERRYFGCMASSLKKSGRGVVTTPRWKQRCWVDKLRCWVEVVEEDGGGFICTLPRLGWGEGEERKEDCRRCMHENCEMGNGWGFSGHACGWREQP